MFWKTKVNANKPNILFNFLIKPPNLKNKFLYATDLLGAFSWPNSSEILSFHVFYVSGCTPQREPLLVKYVSFYSNLLMFLEEHRLKCTFKNIIYLSLICWCFSRSARLSSLVMYILLWQRSTSVTYNSLSHW